MSQEVISGKCIIFSAPSGAGKTTIVHHLLSKIPELEFSVSACSRAERPNERDGIDYYFLGVEGFKNKIKQGAFVEWEEVYENNYYGTLRSELERIWAKGKTVIFDVDVVGGLNLKRAFGDAALSIFVQAPSIDALEERLRYRSTETEEKIQMRLAKAKQELSFADEFDTIVVNNVLEEAFEVAEKLALNFIK